MNINRKIANRNNYGSLRRTSDIKYLVYHFTANDGDTDEGNANYFANNIVKASAHYFVDDNSITQSVDDNYIAYSVGGKKYPNTKGGTFYGKCTNANSLSIEMCDNVRNGVYDFTQNTLNNAIALGQMLMKKYNIPIDRVIRHYDVTGKICPKPFVDNETAWKNFKNRLQGKNVDLDGEVKTKSGTLQNGSNKNGEVSYRGHLRDIGWYNWQCDGSMIGSIGQNRRIEAIQISPVKQMDVTVHIRDVGDKTYKNITKDTVIGTTGKGLRIESLTIKSSDTVYLYRVHQKDIGWSNWCTNGQRAGRIGEKKQIEAIEIKVADIAYSGHVEGSGNTIWFADGMTCGTVGKNLRLEALRIKSQHCGDAYAQAHIQDKGWIDFGKTNQNTVIGTEGQKLRLECIRLKGNFKWRAHIQGTGWTAWTIADGVTTLGTVGERLQIEAIQIKTK